MKIVPGFVLREVAGKSVAISINPALPFRGMLSLNSTAKFLWDMLSERDEADIELTDTAAVLNGLGTYGCRLLSCFFDAAAENPRILFTVK